MTVLDNKFEQNSSVFEAPIQCLIINEHIFIVIEILEKNVLLETENHTPANTAYALYSIWHFPVSYTWGEHHLGLCSQRAVTTPVGCSGEMPKSPVVAWLSACPSAEDFLHRILWRATAGQSHSDFYVLCIDGHLAIFLVTFFFCFKVYFIRCYYNNYWFLN